MAVDSPSNSPKSETTDKSSHEEGKGKDSSVNGMNRGRSPHNRSDSGEKNKSRSQSPSSSRSRAASAASASRDTNSTDPDSVRCRVFIGNLNTDKIGQEELVDHFSVFGKVVGCSLHTNFGFVQYGNKEDADKAVVETHGKTLFGKRVDANIANERRKPQGKERKGRERPGKDDDVPSRRRRSRSRSGERYRSRSPMSKYDELYRRDDPLGRGERQPPRDIYEHRRYDDLYDGRDPYTRGSHPYGREPYTPAPPRTADCEVIATSGDLKNYADSIQSRLTAMGISASVMFPPPEVSILEIIDRISRSGSLYAVVVTSQNMVHKSCTLNILHGAPQEHRNMPLDDALAFVARNFNQYLNDGRDRRPAPFQAPSVFSHRGEPMGKTILTQDSYISGLLNMAVAGTPLKVVEVNHLIEALIKYKNEIDDKEGKSLAVGADDSAPRHPGQPETQQQIGGMEPGKNVTANSTTHDAPNIGYYNQQPYSYGAQPSTMPSTYPGYQDYRPPNTGYSDGTSYASSNIGQQSAPTAYTAARYTSQPPQQMSAYPDYYNRS